MGSILNYSTSCDLLQFAHDFSLWTTLGAKKKLVKAPMRIMTQNLSFMPLYSQRFQYGLVDLVRQLGPPIFFVDVRFARVVRPISRICNGRDDENFGKENAPTCCGNASSCTHVRKDQQRIFVGFERK